jgi:hypothetical protein
MTADAVAFSAFHHAGGLRAVWVPPEMASTTLLPTVPVPVRSRAVCSGMMRCQNSEYEGHGDH